MKLFYIALGIDDMSLGIAGKRPRIAYASEFGYRTNFISNFLSRQIRKAHFETDGTFRMLCVKVTQDEPRRCAIVPDRVLEAQVSFDRERYDRIKGTSDFEYYLEILGQGFRKAADFKEIPLDTLIGIIDEFRKDGYVNEWLHKKKRFKDHDVEVSLNCFFTTLDFRLVATVRRLSTKEELCSGVVLRTEPDELHFDKEFKDVLIDRKNIVITDFLDRPNILIDLDNAREGSFIFAKLPDRTWT